MKEITWCEMVMRYATTCDKIILFWAYFGTICVAVVRPGFSLAFGLVVDGVGETASAGAVKDVSEVGFEQLGDASWFMVGIGVVTGIFQFLQTASFQVFSENVSHRIQIEYFRAAIRKDATYYDKRNPNEMSSKISKEVEAIQRGSSDKMGQIVGNTLGFFAGFAFAFYWGWEFTLILMGVTPFLSITLTIMIWGFTSGIKDDMKAYTQSGGYAEQALQAIQVVHTYGQE